MSGLLMRLNVTTRHWHADVDAPWLDLLRPTVSRADYLAQLVRTYGLVAPFESACKYTPRVERSFDLRQLSRAGLIAQDLLALGLTAAQVARIPQCHAIITFKDVAEAAGWLYVIERSTLLQNGIRRHLLARLPEVNDAFAYLATYDSGVGDHWMSFARMLDEIGEKPETATEMMDAARAGFVCVKQWFHSAESA